MELLATVVAAVAAEASATETGYIIDLATDEALGTFLVDGEGMTLYYFATDVPGSRASACYVTCAELWPIFFADVIEVPADLERTHFNGIERDDGTIQTTNKG